MSRKRKENPTYTDTDRIEEGFQKSLARLTVPKIDPVDSRGIDKSLEDHVEKKRKKEEATEELHNILSQTKKIHSDVTGIPDTGILDTNGGKRRRTRRRSKKSKKRKTNRRRYRK